MEQPSQEILAVEFMKIKNSLIYLAWQFTKNEQDAEEIVSQVIERFLVMINNGELKMYNANYKTYLHIAVRKSCFQFNKRQEKTTQDN